MNKLGLVLGLLLLTISAALGQIIQFSGAPVGTGGSGQPPTVTASIFNIPAPTSNLQSVGPITASNSPTLYTIVSCAGCDNYFQFLNTDQPNLSITVTGAANIVGSATPQTFSPIIQASNPAGNSANATITVNAYLDPIVNSTSFTISPPATARNLGTLTAQNGGITAWTKGTCTPNCATFFGLTNGGIFALTTAGASALVIGTSYVQNVTATNAAGHTGSGTVTVTVSPSIPSNVEAKVFNIPTPALAGDSVGQATADPTGTFAVASCAGCAGFFDINPESGNITLSQLGANAYNGLADKLTFQPVVSADDGSGVKGATAQTVVGWADGFKNAPSCTIQHPALISGNTDYLPTATPPWNVAGIDYCVGSSVPTLTVLAGNSSQQATSATLARNGSRVPDTSAILTLVGGTFSRPAVFRVQTSSLGVITSIVLTDGGAYTSLPPNPVDTTGWPSITQTPQFNVAWSGVAGNSPAGCTKNDTTFTVTCATAGTVVSGWDFGSYVFVCTADGITLSNSSLTVSGHGIPVQATNGCTNFVLTNNVIQGGTNTTPIVSLNGGRPSIRYNWFVGGTSADLIDASGTGSTNLRYNLFENSGASGNWLSTGAGTVTTNIFFNTSYQSAVATTPNGFTFTNGTFNANSETAYNTMISTAGDNLTYAVCLSLPVLGSTANMTTHDNYLDLIGMDNFTCPGSGSIGVVLTNSSTAPLLSETTGQTLISP